MLRELSFDRQVLFQFPHTACPTFYKFWAREPSRRDALRSFSSTFPCSALVGQGPHSLHPSAAVRTAVVLCRNKSPSQILHSRRGIIFWACMPPIRARGRFDVPRKGTIHGKPGGMDIYKQSRRQRVSRQCRLPGFTVRGTDIVNLAVLSLDKSCAHFLLELLLLQPCCRLSAR